MRTTPSLDLADQLCFSLYAASRAMTARYRPLLEELGLTYPQYLAMLVLWKRDSASVRELGKELGMDYGTLSPLVRRLEAAALVTRARRPTDERVVDVTLTDAGRRLKQHARTVPGAAVGDLDVDVEDLTRLKKALDDVRAALESSPTRTP